LAKTISGYVRDDISREALAYVNIGVLGFNKGIISKIDGSFSLHVSPDLYDETLRFSMIGYETQDFRIGDVLGEIEVSMKLKTYDIGEIVIRDFRHHPIKQYGNVSTGKWTTGVSGDAEYGVGHEWGLIIPYKGQPYQPKDINFHMRYNTVDSALFRLMIYDVKDGLPGDPLLQEDVTVKSYKKKKMIRRSVAEYNLIVDRDIIVTVQVLYVWYSSKGKNYFFLTHAQDAVDAQNYSRASSQDAWVKRAAGPLALYIDGWTPQ